MIRPARPDDAPAIARIYNQAILEGGRTGDTVPVTAEDRLAWLAEHSPDAHPVLVAELHGEVLAFGFLSPYRPGRPALLRTAEIGYYVEASHRRGGLGSALVAALREFAIRHGIRNLVAIVIGTNEGSLALLARQGFALWGTYPGVVETPAGELDHLHLGLRLPGC